MSNDNVLDDSEDGKTLNSVLDALYESMSFLPGDEPDWKRLKNLFTSNATFIAPASSNPDGKFEPMDFDTFVSYAKSGLKESGLLRKGFLEVEVSRRMENFGSIAQVFSTFEDRISLDEPEPINRGINSLQLVYYEERWWINSMIWDHESEDQIIPSRYLNVD